MHLERCLRAGARHDESNGGRSGMRNECRYNSILGILLTSAVTGNFTVDTGHTNTRAHICNNPFGSLWVAVGAEMLTWARNLASSAWQDPDQP